MVLSLVRHQAINLVNANLLSSKPLGTNWNENEIKMENIFFKKMN